MSAIQRLSWNFSYVDSATGGKIVEASGTLTTSDVLTPNIGGNNGILTPWGSGYQITGISGQRNGVQITGVVPNPYFPNTFIDSNLILDNGLLTSPLFLDYDGFNFTTADGNKYNLSSLYAPNGSPYIDYVVSTGQWNQITLSVTPVPEPSTIIAGALLALPFGLSTLRSSRKNRA